MPSRNFCYDRYVGYIPPFLDRRLAHAMIQGRKKKSLAHIFTHHMQLFTVNPPYRIVGTRDMKFFQHIVVVNALVYVYHHPCKNKPAHVSRMYTTF